MRKILFLILTLILQASYGQSLRDLYQEGVKAYEANNFELFIKKMEQINKMRPNYPAVVYNLAGGYAMTGSQDLALKTLNQYILMDAVTDFTKDSDFKQLVGSPLLEDLLTKRKALSNPIEVNKARNFSILYSHPESIAFSKKHNAYFIGGVRDGHIWKIEADQTPVLWAKSGKNSWCVMGLAVSKDEKVLWACTSSMDYYQNFQQHEEGFASILKFNLKSGELLETYAIPGGHNFGDLIVDQKENLFISDGVANKLYWIDASTNKLEEFCDLSEDVYNLQGLTFDNDERTIYLSDYIDGIYKLDIASKRVTRLREESDEILIKGIDGLYYKNGCLIGLHNGTKPNRVVKYKLSQDRNSIIGKEILSQAHILGEPTQGVWVEDQFHYITNSPWGAYDLDGNFAPDEEDLIIGIIE